MCAKKQKRTLLSEECPQRAVRNKRLTATSASPEVLQSGADVSRLLAPGRPTHLPSCSCSQWRYESTITARYSGWAAPAFNRFPWLPSAIDCLAKLSTAQRLRKRQDHRCPDDQRQSNEIARIDRSRLWRRRQIDHRHRVLGHVGCEEASEIPLVDRHRIHFLESRTGDASRFVFNHDFIDAGLLFQRKPERE